jgi:hypothetical protein
VNINIPTAKIGGIQMGPKQKIVIFLKTASMISVNYGAHIPK